MMLRWRDPYLLSVKWTQILISSWFCFTLMDNAPSYPLNVLLSCQAKIFIQRFFWFTLMPFINVVINFIDRNFSASKQLIKPHRLCLFQVYQPRLSFTPKIFIMPYIHCISTIIAFLLFCNYFIFLYMQLSLENSGFILINL